MSHEQRHGGRVMQPSGITFNGEPLPPLITGVDNDDNVGVDARSSKRKAMEWYEGVLSGNAAVYAAGAGSSSSTGGGAEQRKQQQVSTVFAFATGERERRRRMNGGTFSAMRRLSSPTSNRVEVVDLDTLKDKDDAAAPKSSSSSESEVTVASYDPYFGVMIVPAPKPKPARPRGARAPTPRPVGPTPPPPPFAIPVANPGAGATSGWPFAVPVPPPAPLPAPRAPAMMPMPVASLRTWAWGTSVVITVMGNTGNLSVRAPVGSGALDVVHAVLHRYAITVVTSLTAVDPSLTHNLFMLYTNIEMPSRLPHFVNPKDYEAMYRAAAAEIARSLADE